MRHHGTWGMLPRECAADDCAPLACPPAIASLFALVRARRLFSPSANLTKHSSAARLDGLNLGQLDGGATEAGRQVGDVEVDALWGLDGAQLGARGAANASIEAANRLLQGAVLLRVVTVGAKGRVARGRGAAAVGGEGLGKLAGGRGRVRLGGMIDRCCCVAQSVDWAENRWDTERGEILTGNGAGADKFDQGGALRVRGGLSKSSSCKHCGVGVVETVSRRVSSTALRHWNEKPSSLGADTCRGVRSRGGIRAG